MDKHRKSCKIIQTHVKSIKFMRNQIQIIEHRLRSWEMCVCVTASFHDCVSNSPRSISKFVSGIDADPAIYQILPNDLHICPAMPKIAEWTKPPSQGYGKVWKSCETNVIRNVTSNDEQIMHKSAIDKQINNKQATDKPNSNPSSNSYPLAVRPSDRPSMEARGPPNWGGWGCRTPPGTKQYIQNHMNNWQT